jgi:hypothetical protein
MSGGRRHYCVVLKRRAALTREQFLHSWLGEHRALAMQLPGVVSVSFMPTTDADQGADGVGMLSFASKGDLERALNSEIATRLRAHTATFADSAAATRLVLCDADMAGSTNDKRRSTQ